jgi:prepilin-type N-terminal cleavage/methylation domain-containing protein
MSTLVKESTYAPKVFNRKKAAGFTLIELLVVIVILGIVSVMVNNYLGGSGITSKAKAEQRYDAALKLVNSWSTVSQFLGVSKNPMDSNLFASAGHDAMDVLIPTDPSVAISTTFQARYIASSTVRALEQFQVVTPPTSSARGVYALGDANNIVTIAYNTVTQNMSVIIQQVPAEEVQALMDRYFPTTAASGTNYTAAARTTSIIQYSTAIAGTHTLTIVRRI